MRVCVVSVLTCDLSLHVCVMVCIRVCVCVCVLDGEGGLVFASAALVLLFSRLVPLVLVLNN